MKRFLLALMLSAFAFFSCEPVENEFVEPEIVTLDASQIVGRWDWTEMSHYYTLNSDEVMELENRISLPNYFTFYANGRFETSIALGILVEGYWTLDGEGIHTFVKDEPLHTLLPIQFDDGVMTIRTPDGNYWRIVCKRSDPVEFTPGYGTVPPEDYFKSPQNVESFMQAIEKEQAAFEPALNELKSIQLTRDNWETVSQIETLWFSSYTVLIRCNQAIDALTAEGASAAAIAPFRYFRAWSSYVRVVCWDFAASYWEHASKDNTLYPIGPGVETIMTAALTDLAGVSTPQAAALKADINALANYAPGEVLKTWGFPINFGVDIGFDFGRYLLPIPMSVVAANMNQIQTPGW